jgi:uncharacterized DUF497 family protein
MKSPVFIQKWYYPIKSGLETREPYRLLLLETADVQFAWDPKKAWSNEQEHRVSFTEAHGVFRDGDALVIPDPDYSETEKRFVILGRGNRNRVIVVGYGVRSEASIIFIISARKAGTSEQKSYWERK